MKTIRFDYRDNVFLDEDISLCLGYFDGLHLGHEDLINTALALTSHPLGLLTFSKPISEFIKTNKAREILTSVEDRKRLLSKFNIDYYIVIDIDSAFFDMSPELFIERILKKLHVKEIFVGEDYRFGLERMGTPEMLKNFFDVHVVELMKIDNKKVSTQDIISLIKEGKIKESYKYLGHPYEVMGVIQKGFQRGQKMGFPTANLKLNANYVMPKCGVYKCIAYVRGIPHIALANVGYHPTVGSLLEPLIEVHIPNFSELMYGMVMYLQFIDFLRPEIKFNSIEELQAQIKEDLKAVEIDFI